MIENEHKLEGCTSELKAIAHAINNEFGHCKIHSGFRNKESNRIAGGSKNSMHLQGRAIDLSVNNVHIWKVSSFLLYNILKYPWTRCAVNNKGNWLHVDNKESKEVPITRFYQNGKWVQ